MENEDKSNLLEFVKKNMKKIIIVVIVLILLFPFAVQAIVYWGPYISFFADNEDWFSFLGSYGGSIIGSGVTIIIFLITIKINNDNHNEQIRMLMHNDIIEQEEQIIRDILSLIHLSNYSFQLFNPLGNKNNLVKLSSEFFGAKIKLKEITDDLDRYSHKKDLIDAINKKLDELGETIKNELIEIETYSNSSSGNANLADKLAKIIGLGSQFENEFTITPDEIIELEKLYLEYNREVRKRKFYI